jgi:hypothetical protein
MPPLRTAATTSARRLAAHLPRGSRWLHQVRELLHWRFLNELLPEELEGLQQVRARLQQVQLRHAAGVGQLQRHSGGVPRGRLGELHRDP